MNFVTPADLDTFNKRNPYDADRALREALRLADEYADQHAPNALPSIKAAIAQLVFRYGLQGDIGEKQLIRIAVDNLIELGRMLNAPPQS